MLKRWTKSVRKLEVTERGPGQAIVSFVLIVYDMPMQAQNTVRSLLSDYQLGVKDADYEVLIVENESKNNMSADFLRTLPSNFHYHLRKESQPTPVHAINYGIEQASGQNVCVMIDGARLLTPGVVKNTIMGHRLSDCSVVTVPGYHLGFELQQKAVASGYGVERETELMQSIGWPGDGYRLFEIACFSGSCSPGFYLAHSESNCISMPKGVWNDLGGYDPKFDMRGGGVVNLDLYKRACEYPGSTHIVLQGEGTFHQFHGGVTTGGDEAEVRERLIQAIMEQYQQIRGEKYSSPQTNPIYLGELSDPAQKFVHLSSVKKLERLGKTADALGASA
ncbi:MAG: hypothetical protein ACI9JM_003376 [Halioglobus sp.]|jgi:hypothetical protein